MCKELASGRDMAFAALAMLRCRERIGAIVNTIPELRRSEVAGVIAELDGFDEGRLKDVLAETMRREDTALRDRAARIQGTGSADAPRAIWKWVARGVGK